MFAAAGSQELHVLWALAEKTETNPSFVSDQGDVNQTRVLKPFKRFDIFPSVKAFNCILSELLYM